MKSKRVLIVDDNDLNRKLFENLIGQLFSYESARNGLEALEMVKNGTFNLILMDIQMPMMDGITAMKKIKGETDSTCPILAVTAYAEESDRANFLEQGFDDFITKPIRPREFLQLIQGYLKTATSNQAADMSQPSEVEILDRTILQRLLSYNSKDAIFKIFEDFVFECQHTDTSVSEYLQGMPATNLLEKIHTLKGNSGTLGAMRIFHTAARAEAYGRGEKTADFDEELKKMRNEIREFRDFFTQEHIFDT